MLVASPEWIARHGEPQTLEELSQHNALIHILRGRPFDRWSLSLDGVVQQQKVSGTVMSDDAEVIRRLAIAGEGIAYKSMLDVSDDLRAGACGACRRVIRGCGAVESDLSAPQTALCRGAFVI